MFYILASGSVAEQHLAVHIVPVHELAVEPVHIPGSEAAAEPGSEAADSCRSVPVLAEPELQQELVPEQEQ